MSEARAERWGATGDVLIGVDPGSETGLAWVDLEGQRLVGVTNGSFWEAVAAVRAMHEQGCVGVVVVEDARSLPIYARYGKTKGRDRLCRSVGQVDRDTTLWEHLLREHLLREHGIPHEMVAPGRQKKWSADTLRRVTGYTRPTNQHGRDAARLVWGRAATWLAAHKAEGVR